MLWKKVSRFEGFPLATMSVNNNIVLTPYMML